MPKSICNGARFRRCLAAWTLAWPIAVKIFLVLHPVPLSGIWEAPSNGAFWDIYLDLDPIWQWWLHFIWKTSYSGSLHLRPSISFKRKSNFCLAVAAIKISYISCCICMWIRFSDRDLFLTSQVWQNQGKSFAIVCWKIWKFWTVYVQPSSTTHIASARFGFDTFVCYC